MLGLGSDSDGVGGVPSNLRLRLESEAKFSSDSDSKWRLEFGMLIETPIGAWAGTSTWNLQIVHRNTSPIPSFTVEINPPTFRISIKCFPFSHDAAAAYIKAYHSLTHKAETQRSGSWDGDRNHGTATIRRMNDGDQNAQISLSGFFPCVCPCYTTDLLPVLCLIFMPNFSIIFTNDIYRNNFYSDICIKELPSSFYCRHTQRCLSGFGTHTLFVA